MNRNHLALFQAVAEAGGISRGAEAARVSQPAVSRQIAELEGELGVRLLDRLPRGCRLTEAGSILAGYALRWRALETDAERAIEEYRGLRRGTLTVGASLTIGGYLLPRILAEFHARCPGVELKVEIANTEHVEEALVRGVLDVGLTEGPVNSDALESTVFYRDSLVAIARAGHPLLGKGPVSARELAKEPLILREEGSGTRAVVERALRAKGIRPKPLLCLASPEAIKGVVAAGMGIAILSRLVVDLEVRMGSLGIVPMRNLEIERPLHLQLLRGRARSPALDQFLETLHRLSKAAPRRA